MTGRKSGRDSGPSMRDRLASSIAASLPGDGGSYEVSSMFSEKSRRRILGNWEVVEHTVAGEPFLDIFARKTLRGRELLSPAYSAHYSFKEGICVKKICIEGFIARGDAAGDIDGGRDIPFKYVLNIAISWEMEPEGIRVKPEMGYQYSSLNEEPAAVRELAQSGQWARIAVSVDGDRMEMREGEDYKILARLP
jgi:hypothetical protein